MPSSLPSGIGRMHIVLVADHQVVDGRLAFFVELSHAIENDDRHFVGIGWVVRPHVGKRDGVQQTVPILMLQALRR